MVALIRRLFAGLMLLPPFTPIGIALWWWARKADKKSRQNTQEADDVAAMREELEELREEVSGQKRGGS